MSDVKTSDGGRRGSDFNPENSDIPMTGSNTDGKCVVAAEEEEESSPERDNPKRDNPERDSKEGEGSKA